VEKWRKVTSLHSTRLLIRKQAGTIGDGLTWKRIRGLAAALIAMAWMMLGVMTAQQAKPGEYQVKAAYLYNFGRFVEWPAKAAEANNAFTVCVLGQDPFGLALNATLADETIHGKSVVAKRIPDLGEAVNCRILFISSSEADRLKQILAALKDASVLTVSDLPNFSQSGGMVQFMTEGSRVRFEVNLAPAERAGLVMSSELLKVAVNVRRGGAVGD
jgi:hypothetical protein